MLFFGTDYDGVQAIQRTLTDNYGSNRVGLGEVRFSQSAVPEPNMMAFVSIGGLGLLLRHRR
jgi:PEP-CTERM motif